MKCYKTGSWVYKRREPEKSQFYQLIQANLNTFLHQREQENKPVPSYVQKQFNNFLKCGILAHGFLRLECEKCKTEHLVAFSCKSRLCPSCLARRMTETAIHLTENVIPEVKMRQYVLTFPTPIRLLLARNENILAHLCQKAIRCIQEFIIQNTARNNDAHTGSVLFIQRFGSSLNLNIHFHILFMDGVYETKSTDRIKFYQQPKITNLKLTKLLNTIIQKTIKFLLKQKIVTEEEGTCLLNENTLAEFLNPHDLVLEAETASVQNIIAFGTNKGQPVKRYRLGQSLLPTKEASSPSELCIQKDGFSLHALRVVKKEQRDRLLHLIQYMIRPPIAEDRLTILPNGQIKIALKNAWADGTYAIELSQLEFLEKILAILPPPFFHEVRYYGIFAANATLRKKIVRQNSEDDIIYDSFIPNGTKNKKYIPWSVLLKKTFALDILRCPKCGNRMWIWEIVEDHREIDATLFVLGLPADPPRPDPPRIEPTLFDDAAIDPPFYDD